MASSFQDGRKDFMVIVDALLVIALLFFLFLPITDRKRRARPLKQRHAL
jgi:hypothetical protein